MSDGHPLKPTSFSPRFKEEMRRLGRGLGLSKPLNHKAMRHAFATKLQTVGAHVKTAQAMLGHGSSKTTDRYFHPLPAEQADAMARIDERWRRMEEQSNEAQALVG
jgi:site-specific recombinase XerD